MNLIEAIEEYRLSCAAVPISPKTWVWYEQKLRVFRAFLRDECDVDRLEAVQVRHANRFTEWLRETPTDRGLRSSSTVRGYLEVVRNFLSWAVEEDLISSRVRERVALPKAEKKVIRTINRQQYNLLLAAAEREYNHHLRLRDRAMLALLIDTGIRASELCTLLYRDLHLGTDPHVLVRGKGNKQREVGPLGTETQKHLRRHLRGHEGELVFVNRYHAPLNPNGLDQLLYRLRDWAGPEHFTGIRVSAHTFRHTYAVNYMAGGGDIYTLSLLLGHTSVAVTQNYLRDFQQRNARRGGSVLDAF